MLTLLQWNWSGEFILSFWWFPPFESKIQNNNISNTKYGVFTIANIFLMTLEKSTQSLSKNRFALCWHAVQLFS